MRWEDSDMKSLMFYKEHSAEVKITGNGIDGNRKTGATAVVSVRDNSGK